MLNITPPKKSAAIVSYAIDLREGKGKVAKVTDDSADDASGEDLQAALTLKAKTLFSLMQKKVTSSVVFPYQQRCPLFFFQEGSLVIFCCLCFGYIY